MRQKQERQLLGISLIIWALQLLYVAFALGLFALLAIFTNQVHHLLFQLVYVLVMIVINVAWRIALTKKTRKT